MQQMSNASDGRNAKQYVEALTLVQQMANCQQLVIAMTTSARILTETQSKMSALVSDADDLVCSKAAVPKHEILPLFHQVGQLFHVRPCVLARHP